MGSSMAVRTGTLHSKLDFFFFFFVFKSNLVVDKNVKKIKKKEIVEKKIHNIIN